MDFDKQFISRLNSSTGKGSYVYITCEVLFNKMRLNSLKQTRNPCEKLYIAKLCGCYLVSPNSIDYIHTTKFGLH